MPHASKSAWPKAWPHLNSYKPADELSRERLHQVRDLTIMLRNRKVKPEKGRRKDLRKIDSLITDLHLFMQNGVS